MKSIENHKEQKRIESWIIEDLNKSGLTLDNFYIEPLTSEIELKERLGFMSLPDKDKYWTKIIEIGGYWIPYSNIPDYYRLKLRKEIGDAKYLSRKSGGNQPYILDQLEENLSSYSPDKSVFITEGEKKAAKATIEGFSCIGLSGVFNFKEKDNDFLPKLANYIWKNRLVYIVFDSDITHKYEVRRAELKLAIELNNRKAKVYSVRLPSALNGDKNGLDDYLVQHGPEAFTCLINEAKPTIELQIDEGTDKELILDELPRLKDKIFKEQILKTLAKREGVKIELVKVEYQKHIPNKEGNDQSPQDIFTEVQLEKAKSLLRSPNILRDMVSFTERLGFIGEQINQMLLYLTFTSRLMTSSISAVIKGQSSSGKSHLVGTVLRLIPESDILNFSFVTSKALVHRQGDLSHKILYITEHSGSEGADYSIRTLLSEGEISIMLPIKNENTGNFETNEKRIPAHGLVFIQTTTKDRVHAENQTRVFDLYIDDSQTQTTNILRMQAEQLEPNNAKVLEEVKIWQAAQTLLKDYQVFIPYAKELAEHFPKDKPRARRDFPRFLSLIGVHTMLNQFQRVKGSDGRLIATIEDFEAILPLAETVLAQTLKELSPKQEETLNIMQRHFEDKEFSVKELSEKANNKVTYRTIQRYCEYFTKEGVLDWNGMKGAGSKYTITTPLSSFHNKNIFPTKLLKTLKNKYSIPNCHNLEQLTPFRTIIFNDDKWFLTLPNSDFTSNNSELYQFCLHNVNRATSNKVNDWLFSPRI